MDRTASFEYVGFWTRVVICLLDGLILTPIMLANFYLTALSVNWGTVIPVSIFHTANWLALAWIVSRFGGISVPLTIRMSRRPCNCSGNGSNPNPYRQRCAHGGLHARCSFIVFNRYKRAIHDYAAGSFVVTRRSWLEALRETPRPGP